MAFFRLAVFRPKLNHKPSTLNPNPETQALNRAKTRCMHQKKKKSKAAGPFEFVCVCVCVCVCVRACVCVCSTPQKPGVNSNAPLFFSFYSNAVLFFLVSIYSVPIQFFALSSLHSCFRLQALTCLYIVIFFFVGAAAGC